jgi:SAM-dependent methyltransferase
MTPTVCWNGTEVPIDDDPLFSGQPLTLPVPNATLRAASSVREAGAWFAIGEAWACVVSRFLPDAPFVIDLGCGCGKLARFLYLNPRVRYLGLDLFLPAIAWCRRAFHPLAGDRFRFEHFDGYSPAYNPQGTLDPGTYVLPCPDSAADTVVCGSLFTHLSEPVCKHYLHEIRRVLKPRGRAIISIHFEPPAGSVFAGDESRIDIDPDYFRNMARAAGLGEFQTVGIVYGQLVIVFEAVQGR